MNGYGAFVWYELLTSDKKAAEAFYTQVMGWACGDAGQPGIDYAFLSVGDARIGGMMTMPKEARQAGAPIGWLGYVAVKDADESARSAAAKGGRVLRAPEDIPGYGRFAVLADPQGASFCVIAPSGDHAAPQIAHRPGVPGFCCWHELYTDRPEAALDFYSGMFGWTKGQAFDCGDIGLYQLFLINGAPAGGMMKRPPQTPTPVWDYYFNVDSAEAAAARVRDAGGRILMGPQQTPDRSWIIKALDPQGGWFSLISANR